LIRPDSIGQGHRGVGFGAWAGIAGSGREGLQWVDGSPFRNRQQWVEKRRPRI